MLELKNDYMQISAKRESKESQLVNVRIELTGHKPVEQLKDDIFDMEWFMFKTFEEYLGSPHNAEKAMTIFADGDNMIKLSDDKLPLVKEYPFLIEDIKEGKIKKELMLNAIVSSENKGLLTEEALLLTEAFDLISKHLPYIDYWDSIWDLGEPGMEN